MPRAIATAGDVCCASSAAVTPASAVDRADGEVDAAGDEHERAGGRDGQRRGLLVEDVEQVDLGQERRARHRERDEERGERDRDAARAQPVQRRSARWRGRRARAPAARRSRSCRERGRQHRRLGHLLAGELADDPARAHDEHAVGEPEDLLELGRDQQHAEAVVGQRDEQVVDRPLARRRPRRASARRPRAPSARTAASARRGPSAGCRRTACSPARRSRCCGPPSGRGPRARAGARRPAGRSRSGSRCGRLASVTFSVTERPSRSPSSLRDSGIIATPSRNRLRGPPVSRWPSVISTVPGDRDARRRTPRARSSLRPAPTSPARATISPARTVKLTPSTPGACRSRTVRAVWASVARLALGGEGGGQRPARASRG